MTALTSILLLPLGPLFMPRFYLVFLFIYFLTFLYTQISHLFKFYLTANKMIATIRRWNYRNSDGNYSTSPTPTSYSLINDLEASTNHNDTQLIHGFIVPNYAEPIALLRATIRQLANHKNAFTNYVIILAMEASEVDHEIKADCLNEEFKDNFLHFIVTSHPSDIPGETRGKGSNVAYAARQGCACLIQSGIDKKKLVLTVSDSDSSIPELYIKELEHSFFQADQPHSLLFAPPIFFSRNSFEVPAAVRMTDITWSAMVMSSLSNSRGLSFPCSTYSLSMLLAEKVDYWDTDADSVGEDMHMMLKCFFRTDGMARCCPIFVPINLTNVQTSGYLSNMNARYVQAKRHYNGVADLAYTLKKSFGVQSELDTALMVKERTSIYVSPHLATNKIIMCIKVMEAHMIPVTSGWLMFAAVPLMQFILFPPHSMVTFVGPEDNPILTSDFFCKLWNIVKIITLFLPFPLFGTLAIYEKLHRIIDRELYNKAQTRTWSNLLDYTSLPIAAWMFMTIPSTIACLKRLYKPNEQYIVSEKHLDSQ
ncbi:hypothetical protein BDB01DRAFT_843928 [Pilobolus umbonatus]|nr:hypothetical protein BDB01DRAFT_843928 [Pilobolus umbonatus]